jgi:hypothetical protein
LAGGTESGSRAVICNAPIPNGLAPAIIYKIIFIDERIKSPKTAGGSASDTAAKFTALYVYKILYKNIQYAQKMGSGSDYAIPERLKDGLENLQPLLDTLF